MSYVVFFKSNLQWFGDGAQNESGKVAVYGDSLAMCQLRQMWAITFLSGYNYTIWYYKLFNY